MPLWLRRDLPRELCARYWREAHGQLVAHMPGIHEYRQHHFDPDDYGFWPAPGGVEASVPEDWHPDGMPEVFHRRAIGVVGALGRVGRQVLKDEQNAFERTLAYVGLARIHEGTADVRAVVLLRRRQRVGWRGFASFVHRELGSALSAASELRTYVFGPYTTIGWSSPGVAHDNPPERRWHAAIVLGAESREAIGELLDSNAVLATRGSQARLCAAIHAFAVADTYVMRERGRPTLAGLRGVEMARTIEEIGADNQKRGELLKLLVRR